ncbi:hypothetical protein Pcinc_007677 [Petrolisthes cinctipes]|uniref:CUB domain-containing protein n=1 Tax=Petrolisthes cinctipes TaxID=88211 RepID=A0AAE1GAL7_PETCI|nr:hypothetical protein Pcinc_007677 [Petrolisthes cinctipes]
MLFNDPYPGGQLIMTSTRQAVGVVVLPSFHSHLCEATKTGVTETGVCLPYFTCLAVGAVHKGHCRLGLGHCCVFEKTCGQNSKSKVTYFTDARVNATSLSNCAVVINKAHNICQLRLSMIELELSEPNYEGVCDNQYLQVIGADKQMFHICGTNTGQHSPVGCDQYYLQSTGSVKSFNYATTPSSALIPNTVWPGTRHLQETYTICVKPGLNHCGLSWTPSSDQPSFTITDQYFSNETLPGGGVVDSLCGRGVNGTFTDYLMIPGGQVYTTTTSTISTPGSVFCGIQFPPEVRAPGYQITFVANNQEASNNDADNRGFHLLYREHTNCRF